MSQPVKPSAIYFRISDIPMAFSQMMKEDLKAIARLGDGDSKKYDHAFDSDDLREFYRLNPIANRFQVTDIYFDKFNKNDREDYHELHRKLIEAIHLYGEGTQAQFNINDSHIPVDDRKILKKLAQQYPDPSIVEDMDLYVFAEEYNFPFSQLVSLSTFRTANGYNFDSLVYYLDYIEKYKSETIPPFNNELIYSDRLINIGDQEKIKIPFSTEYANPDELRAAFDTITEKQAQALFVEYPRVGLVAPKIIVGVNGSTGYYLHQPKTGVAQAFPITNTTYLFPYEQDRIYRATLNLRGKTTIEVLDSSDESLWSFTLNLGGYGAPHDLSSFFKVPFDEAKKNPLYEKDPELAIDHAFDVVLRALKEKRNVFSFTFTGHCSLGAVTVLQDRLKEALVASPNVHIPQALFDLMAEALPDVKLSNTTLGIIPMEFDSDIPDYTDEKKQQKIVSAFEKAVAQIKLFSGDPHDHDQADYLWTIGSRIRLVKIVPQSFLDGLNPGLKIRHLYYRKDQVIYVAEDFFASDKNVADVLLHDIAHAAIYKMLDMGVLSEEQYKKIQEDIKKTIIPRLNLQHPIANHPFIQRRTSNGGEELLTNALKLYWTNPDELKQVSEPLYNLFHNLHHEIPVQGEVNLPINPFALWTEQKDKLSTYVLNVWKADIAARN